MSMKNKSIIFILGALMLTGIACKQESKEKHRVFIFTDININSGDPDDRQSLIHLLWYADELEIEGIVPDRWNAFGLEASQLAVNAYSKDFQMYELGKKGYPYPEQIQTKLATGAEDAINRFISVASVEGSPLYVLVWGNMELFGTALRTKPELSENIRLITIGTGLMLEEHMEFLPEDWPRSEPCVQLNWNGWGRNAVFKDPQFADMWWLEINWTYNGMFTGPEPEEIWHKLSQYGHLGEHMIQVTEKEPWARYFRVGDTPSVLYLIDHLHNPDDPTRSSWAGRFVKPFPDTRPNYFTDDHGRIEWDYTNPCNTWENHVAVHDYAKGTLEKERPHMYEALLEKLNRVYDKN
jgi:hypothetical protein